MESKFIKYKFNHVQIKSLTSCSKESQTNKNFGWQNLIIILLVLWWVRSRSIRSQGGEGGGACDPRGVWKQKLFIYLFIYGLKSFLCQSRYWHYSSTFSGSAVIKLFLKMSNFSEIICLKCWNFRKLQGKEKNILKMVVICELLLARPNPPLQGRYPIINNSPPS